MALKVPEASWRDFFSYYSKWKNGKVLLGTAGSWFLMDVAFHGLSLHTALILQAINYGTGPTVYKILYNVAAGNCILVCAGSIPGYWTTVTLVDTVGRKPIQLMGFIVFTILSSSGVLTITISPEEPLSVSTLWFSSSSTFGKAPTIALLLLFFCSFLLLSSPLHGMLIILQAQTRQPLLFQGSASQRATARHHTVHPLPLAKSGPSSPRQASRRSV